MSKRIITLTGTNIRELANLAGYSIAEDADEHLDSAEYTICTGTDGVMEDDGKIIYPQYMAVSDDVGDDEAMPLTDA